MEKDKLEKLQEIIDNSKNIVFLGGAGVSTESGIPDFRSTDGLYASEYKGIAPEEILSAGFFKKDTELFWKFYREKILMIGYEKEILPNTAHYKLAELEKAGKLKAIITQNIDDLHQKAGSQTVYQIHGNILKYYCVGRKHEYDLDFILKCEDSVPRCPECGSKLKPDVVLYGEPLPSKVFANSITAVKNADTMIVAGTSLRVYPAASLLDYFHGDNLVLINRDPTPADNFANLVINDSIGKVLGGIKVNGKED